MDIKNAVSKSKVSTALAASTTATNVSGISGNVSGIVSTALAASTTATLSAGWIDYITLKFQQP